jgi:flagellin-like hook-associated protein FlgL
MSDAIEYCPQCTANVMCHMRRGCVLQSIAEQEKNMKDRPTPETDSLINSWDASRLEKFPFAFVAEAQALMMRLERERDEAREAIADVRSALKAEKFEGARLAALRVIEERDEALAQAERLRGKLGAALLELSLLKQNLAEISEIITKGGTTDEVLRFITSGEDMP